MRYACVHISVYMYTGSTCMVTCYSYTMSYILDSYRHISHVEFKGLRCDGLQFNNAKSLAGQLCTKFESI